MAPTVPSPAPQMTSDLPLLAIPRNKTNRPMQRDLLRIAGIKTSSSELRDLQGIFF